MKNLNQLRQWCRDTFHYYVVFKKSIFFILGLILSYKLVEKTFLDILITHLNDVWKDYDLRRGNAVVNFREGMSAILLPPFAYVADVYTGRFKMMFFSCAVCIIGLLLNWLAARNDEQLELGLFYPALGLITLAQAAQTITLQAFLEDQLRSTYPDDDTTRRRYGHFWWTFVSFVAAIFAQFGPLPGLEFRNLAIVLTAVMGGSFLVFLLGTKCYTFVGIIQNPFKDVGTVILGVIARKNVEYPQTQAGYFLPIQEGLFDVDSSGDLHIRPRVPWLRWLDKAAIITDMELACPSTPSVEQVRRVKFLLKMLPLWSCFLIFSLVVASGSTFFLEEATSLAAEDDLKPILFLTNLQRLTLFVVSEISSYVVRKFEERKKYKKQKMELVRIGIGMSCCVPCCIAAWATATRRQHDNNGASVFLLTPQFLFLGLMGGLAQEGLESFYGSQVLESLSTYGPPFGEFIMGIGKFVSILCILIFSRSRFKWFENELDDSRLDKYYILLGVLSFGNVIIYCLAACWYGDDAFLLEGAVEGEEMGPIAHLLNDDGLASRSIEGKHSSRRSLFHRTATKPESGDIITASSSSGSRYEEEKEEERDEAPLLATKKNSAYNYLLRLRMATTFLRLFSRTTRRRSDSNLVINND